MALSNMEHFSNWHDRDRQKGDFVREANCICYRGAPLECCNGIMQLDRRAGAVLTTIHRWGGSKKAGALARVVFFNRTSVKFGMDGTSLLRHDYAHGK